MSRTKSATKNTVSDESGELAALELFADAQQIVEDVFGEDKAEDESYVFEVYDLLETVGDLTDKVRKEFVADLNRAKEIASEMFGVGTPTPTQVFGVFERVYMDDSDE